MSVLILGVKFGEGAFCDAADVAGGMVESIEPCLCAQNAPAWRMHSTLDAEEWKQLQEHADKGCAWCQGTGRETHSTPKFYLNWSLDVVSRLHVLLGLVIEPVAVVQTPMPLFAVRRGLMIARATFDKVGPALTRDEVAVRGSLPQDDGTVKLHAYRYWQPALDLEQLRHRVELFATFVEAVAAEGATHIVFDS
jgi:hypothetical protein